MRATVLLLTASLITSALAGPIYQFNPTSTGITNRGVALFWGDTLAYQNRSNFLVNATQMPAGIPIEFTKASNGVVRALTSVESNAVNTYTASNLSWQVAAARTNTINSAIGHFSDTNSLSRMDRAIVIGLMNALNSIRTQASLALPALTTNQIVTSISNLIRLDPR